MSGWLYHVQGPRAPGPGERAEMLARARQVLEERGVEEVERLHVGDRGPDDPSVAEVLIPALQSDSLFGGHRGIQVVEAHQLDRESAELVAGLLSGASPGALTLVLVSSGALPAPLREVVRELGERLEVKKLRERDAAGWLGAELERRGLRLDQEAVGALLQRFGSDVAGLDSALDQLASAEGKVDREAILARFRNRPDEPMWHYADAVSAGDAGEALRRLSDFLTHGHPLQLLAFLENDLRRRALASCAPDLETFAEWVGSSPSHYGVKKIWRRRHGISDSELRRALDALARADAQLKSAPEEMHRITMERLTVALCRWYGGPARRAG